MLEGGIKRRCDDLVSVGEQLKGVRQDTREAIEGGQLRFFERRRRNNNEAKEFNQFKQARIRGAGGSTAYGVGGRGYVYGGAGGAIVFVVAFVFSRLYCRPFLLPPPTVCRRSLHKPFVSCSLDEY